MHVARFGYAKRIVQQNMARDAGDPFFCAHDMSDAHGVIIDDVGKVICRVPV